MCSFISIPNEHFQLHTCLHTRIHTRVHRYESSSLKAKEVTSLDDYISRMPPHQKNIYYLTVSSREYADVSPYFEKFKKDGIEVCMRVCVYAHRCVDIYV